MERTEGTQNFGLETLISIGSHAELATHASVVGITKGVLKTHR